MNTRHLILIALCAFPLAISAAAESIKLTVNEVFSLANPQNGALTQLDAGVTHVIKAPALEDGTEPEPKIVTTAYDFTAATRLAIYRNRRALVGVLEDFDKSRIALVKRIWGEKPPEKVEPDSPQQKEFEAKLTELANEKVAVEITRLKPEDLLRGGNPIPQHVLLRLQPILTEK